MTNTWVLSLLALSAVGGATAGRALPAASNKPVEARPANGREEPTTPKSSATPRPRARVSVPFTCCADVAGRNVCVSGSCDEGSQPTCKPTRDDIGVSCTPRRERRADER